MKRSIILLGLLFGCSNEPPTVRDVVSTTEAVSLSGLTWLNIKTEVPGYNGVACLAKVLAGRIYTACNTVGSTHCVEVRWFGRQAWFATTDEETIQVVMHNPYQEDFLAEYVTRTSTATTQVIDYLSLNGRTSRCVINRTRGTATFEGEI